MQCLVRAPLLATPSGARRPLGNTATAAPAGAARPSTAVGVVVGKKPMQQPRRIVPRAAMKDVASAAAGASGLTVKEAEAAVRAAFDFIAAEVRMEEGD